MRNVGNFAAHLLKDTNTGEIVEVEPGEAEWLLDVLEGLFDFYFVQPATATPKRDALNVKLKAAGKPEMKSPGARRSGIPSGHVALATTTRFEPVSRR